jgi:hypothetical protein
MRVRGETLGALNFFRQEPGRMAGPDLALGQGLADIAAIALLQQRALEGSRGVIEQLQYALNSRVIIEQAKGMLAERAGIGVDAAFSLLRGYARDHNQRLSAVARDLTDGHLDAAALSAHPHTRCAASER